MKEVLEIEKLIIKDGIITNKSICGIPINVKIIEPVGERNVRTLRNFIRVPDTCYHNTANTAPTAGDEIHHKWLKGVEADDSLYVSPHIFIDHDSITQVIPLNEEGYHAGTKLGNRMSIGVEICENAHIAKAEFNAKVFGAAYLAARPETKIKKHQD